MVGIVLASHGGLADGIAESAEMLFGKQTNFAHVILEPKEGPDDIRGKMEKAIASFDNQDEVLFIVDLWGGTPFNQANGLVEKHADKWAIVTGMNLPMVVQALTERMTNKDETARQIATAIIAPARDGIKTKPADLMPKSEKKAAAPANKGGAKRKSIPKGTVIGDGHIKYSMARIDSRLLHGQVATGWIPEVKPDRVIVVSDSVAKDEMRKSMIREAAPAGVKAHTVPIKKMEELAKDPRFGNTHVFLLFENPEDALKAIQGGVKLKTLNLGSMSYKDGDVNANNVLSMNQEDVDSLRKLQKMGIKFDVRKVPSDNPENIDHILNHAQELLDAKKK